MALPCQKINKLVHGLRSESDQKCLRVVFLSLSNPEE